MNGNVTKEGIRRDLEWMKRVGLGGFQNFDASLFGDTVVDKRVAYMTPGVERRVPLRDRTRRPPWPRDGHRRLAGLERDRAARGSSRSRP